MDLLPGWGVPILLLKLPKVHLTNVFLAFIFTEKRPGGIRNIDSHKPESDQ